MTLRFPPPGPPRRVPRLQRYYQSAMTSCRPFRRASFPSLGGTSRSLVRFAHRRTSVPPRPGVGHPVTPAGNPRGNDRTSQVPGEPRLSVCTCSVDAGRTAYTRPLRCGSVALGMSTAKAPTKGISTLNSMAFELAAGTVRSMVGFAAPVTRSPRKTRFRPLVRRYRTGFAPAGFR